MSFTADVGLNYMDKDHERERLILTTKKQGSILHDSKYLSTLILFKRETRMPSSPQDLFQTEEQTLGHITFSSANLSYDMKFMRRGKNSKKEVKGLSQQ